VRTPLWFKENLDKLKSVGEIAEVLLKLYEDPAYKGGTVLEASGQGRTRVVKVLNDPGPPTVGHDKGANRCLRGLQRRGLVVCRIQQYDLSFQWRN
jgi:hypothetical protein